MRSPKETIQREADGVWESGNMPKKGGFRRIDNDGDEKKECKSYSHNPPIDISLPAGTYEYTCPECGNTTIVNIPKITL